MYKPRCEYKMPGGKEPLTIIDTAPIVDPTPSIPHANAILFDRYRIENLLRSGIERLGGTVEYGTELRGFEQFPDRVDAVLLTSQGQPELLSCHWLVGADGAEGITRQELGLSFLGETRHGEPMVLGMIEVQGLASEYWHQWGSLTAGGLMLLPTIEKPGYFGFFLSGGALDLKRLVTDEQALRHLLRKRVDREDLVFGRIDFVIAYRPDIRMVKQFSEGRVFVAGDAAHVHSLVGSQGMNSGFIDAFNLAWKLALVEKGLASPSLLATYTEERLPVIAEMIEKSTQLHDAIGRSEDAGWERGGGLHQLGVNYRWSSIVVDDRTPKVLGPQHIDPYGSGTDGTLRAGDRAPDAPELVPADGHNGSDETLVSLRLFSIFGPEHHTVILFNTPEDLTGYILLAVKKYRPGLIKTVLIRPQSIAGLSLRVGCQPDLTVVDQGGHAAAGYQVSPEKPMIVIVRPDGYVGGIVYGYYSFTKYFGGIFSVAGDRM
ncbi:hypothetical protein FOMPIDRAFT_138137 [Fomitopsis schrenkii]|uniref:FAD-binding domain-containing protein n=1 Tax=Fomitopsis schrenkii TaxID=2126942 RepID=S8F598_FOMSC|nr:hypothetical protein FOMPIDRAFT_138137 [Fomitopsis schrenkii]